MGLGEDTLVPYLMYRAPRKNYYSQRKTLADKSGQLIILWPLIIYVPNFIFKKNFFLNFYFYLILLYNTVLVLPYIDMNPPRVYMRSQTWTFLYFLSNYLIPNTVMQFASILPSWKLNFLGDSHIAKSNGLKFLALDTID